MLLKSALSWPFAALLVLPFAVSCGARTGIDAGAPAPSPCAVDLDCDTGDACARAECREGVCVALPAMICDDHDACTVDSCDPDSGKCLFVPATLDLDGDGYRSPKPGYAPGAPGACGNDCDDRSAAAHPGGVEVCDGVDNDCNGKVDDGALYGAATRPVRVASTRFDRALSAGLAFDGKNYGASFSGHQQRFSSYFVGLSRDGVTSVPETRLSGVNSETYAGPLLHNGSYFETAWSDARQDGNYEVYFNRYDSSGNKLGPDLRVTDAPNFSLNAALVWNGSETLVVWDDRRLEQRGSSDIRLFGQRIAFDGTLRGDNVALTPPGTQADTPSIALGEKRVGVVFASQLTSTVTHAAFFSTGPDLTDPSALVDLGGTEAQNVTVVHAGGRFVVAWQRYGSKSGPGPSISGAVVDESGHTIISEMPITSGANYARNFALISLGDRVVLVWVDDHDGNFELYRQILDPSLNVLSPRTRLTFTPEDTLSPVAALGPSGDIGVLYDDWQSGDREPYFLSMSCQMGETVPSPK